MKKNQPDTGKKKTPRNPENTTATFSLPASMKLRIEQEAKKSDRTVSQWLVHNLKKIISDGGYEVKPALTALEKEKKPNGKTA